MGSPSNPLSIEMLLSLKELSCDEDLVVLRQGGPGGTSNFSLARPMVMTQTTLWMSTLQSVVVPMVPGPWAVLQTVVG